MPDERVMSAVENGDAPQVPSTREHVESTINDRAAASSADQAVEHVFRTRLSGEFGAALESPDPAAGLDKAVQTVADEISRLSPPEPDSEIAIGPDAEVAGAIETLVRVALEMDDPVAALEEGAESLAEALAARDAAEQEWLQAAEEMQLDQQAAYRHARFHRVSELIDVGYSLDQAVAITDADEADIRARATAAGRNPMEPIYQYAILNGYQGMRSAQASPIVEHERPLPRRSHDAGGSSPSMEILAQLSEKAFAEATRGDRWQALMRR